MMQQRLIRYLKPPIFPADEDKTFTASLLHVILWSLLVGICLYTLIASVLSLIQPHMLLIAWLYVLAIGMMTVTLMAVMRRGYVRRAAIAVNIGLWLIMTVAAYFNGGVAAPAYSGYLIVIMSTCLLVSWQWGLVAAIASALAGAIFLLAAENHWLPDWLPTYSFGSVWSADVVYFFVACLLLALALRTIKRAAQQTHREMSDRLRAEEALRQSEQRFHAIFDSVNDAIFVHELSDGRILDANKTMCEMYGCTVEEARQLSVADLSANYPPFTQQDAMSWWRKAAHGEPQIFEWLAKDRTGRLFWVEVNMRQAMIDGQYRLLVVARNIEDRRRAEEREQRVSQGLRTVIEAAQELIDCADLDSLYRRSVELAREKLGLERCALYLLDDHERFIQGTFGTDDRGQTTDEHTARHPVQEHPEVFQMSERIWLPYERVYTYWEVDHDHLVGGTGWNVVTPIRSRRRTVGVLYNDAAITRASLDDTQQDIVAVYCSLLGSLLELKHAEVELAYERDLLQALMDNFPDTIYFKDKASRFTRINRAQARMLGIAVPEAAIGKTDADFFRDDKLNAMFLTEEQHLMTSGEPIIDRVEYNPRPDGQPRWLSASKVPLRDAAGQIVGMVGISRDVTDRILAQRHDQTISEGSRAVIEAADELLSCADLDTLYRRAIELAREKLKVERCGLFTLDEQGWLCGTYGTDLQGQTSDERSAHFRPVNLEGLNATSDQAWKIIESEHAFWEGDQHRMIGAGWVGATFIRTRDRVMGVFYNDTAITHTPVDEAQQEVLAVYCSLLGSLIELKRAEEALRESESTMRALLDAIPDAIFRLDAQGVFKDFIPAKNFVALLSPESFIGKSYAQVLPPEMLRPLNENFQSVLEKGELRLYEYALRRDEQAHYYESRLVKMAQGDVLGIVRDVTDRKQAELSLQQREAYLRSILDNFPYWVWLKDTSGRFLAVNKTLANTYGYASSEELVGRSDDDITTHDLAEQYRADDRWVMESRTQKLVEEIVVEHGVERWFETFKSPVFDVQGNVIGTTGFAHDVTARRQAEAAIRESEALFRNLADNAPAFIAMIDESGLATYLNRAWQDFRGNVPVLPLDSWAERIHPDDRRRYTHEFRSALQERRKFTIEYRLRRADGQYRWLLDTAVPRYAADERFAGFSGIAVDITDRKNAEEALRRSEGRLRLLTDNMVDVISQIDAQQRLVYSSPSAERVFGYALRDLLGNAFYDFAHPDDTARLRHHMVMAIELHMPSLRLEYRYRHAAGHYLWVESEMRLLYDSHGEFTGGVLGSRDISARKQIEVEREQLIRELEDKNAELERFTYTVSHDLKSPLITIRGFLGFLEKDAVSGNLDQLRTDMTRIVEATTRMQRLLDELLDLSRIGRMSNQLEAVAFDQIAREAVELVQGRTMARGVRVEIADNLPTVYGDRMRLVEAVQNLVDNAVKFMGNQPEPRVVIGALEFERAGLPIFFVQDNGVGIEAEYQERIFGLFNKLDAQSEGTGVGLALVRRIIEMHGGHIWVESDGIGQGSTFFFTLPRPALASGND
jgi:PAS domain S-box-containing protein